MDGTKHSNQEQVVIPNYKELVSYYKPVYFTVLLNLIKAMLPSLRIRTAICLFLCLFTVITFIVSKLHRITDILPDFWFCYFSGILIVFFGLLFLYKAWHKHIASFEYIKLMVVGDEKQDKLMNSFLFIYRSPIQLYLGLLISFFGSMVIISIYPDVPLVLKVYSAILGFLCSLIAFLGCWCAVTSILFLRTFLSLDDLKFNPLVPGQTIGIIKLSKLMTDYATLFSAEFFLALTPFVYISLTSNLRTPPIDLNSFPYQLSLTFFIFFFIVTIPAYFFYPQILICSRIVKEKHEKILKIEKMIHSIYNEEECQSNYYLNQVNQYTYLLNIAIEGKVSTKDFSSIIKVVGSLVLPTVMLILSQPIVFTSIIAHVRTTVFGSF